MKIPKDWPTEEMRRAAIEEQRLILNMGLSLQGDEMASAVFKAMLAAAPTPPTQSNVWKEAVLLQCMAIEGCYNESNPIATMNCLIDWHVKNATPPAQEAEPVGIYSPFNACLFRQHCRSVEQQSDKLRQAAATVLAWFDSPMAVQLSNKQLAQLLRTALEGKS